MTEQLSNIATVNQLDNTVNNIINDVNKDIMELEYKLTEEQEKLLTVLYDQVKETSDLILHHPAKENYNKLSQMISFLMKHIEKTKMNGNLLSGKSKKEIVLELSKLLIKKLVKDDQKRIILMMMYKNVGEELLETMVDISNHLNVKERDGSCLEGVLKCIK
jgi:hypothetical protein